ncbi:hypothetical protein [Antribacter gilvus]|uniref:hypothetical protein n=1 Tax=Antribacter gilvus TaxID=2304675 RepID=UPI0013DF91B1|nr:hypothetical protein [Antribacter gilvus]
MADATPQPEAGTPADRGTDRGAERAVFRTALRDGLILVGSLAVLGVVVGGLVAGLPGVWGALLGAGIAAFFSATTVWSMLRTVGANPVTMGAVVMGSWLAKIIVLIVVLAVISRFDFYDRIVLFVVLALGAIGSALLDYRAVRNGRVPYVSPGS